MNKPIIIGAGITGLSAANYFVDNNVHPIIIEADVIGKPKVCGEFFSGESIPLLKKWEIPYLTIQKANFNIQNNKYSFSLPTKAASTSRAMCELELEKRARTLGAQILPNMSVHDIKFADRNNDSHLITLSSGEVLETNKLIITTSKLPILQKKNSAEYVGIKAHFTNIDIPNELNMYFIKNAYMGLTYIDSSVVNVCCLVRKEELDKFSSIDSFMDYFFSMNVELKKIFNSATMLNEKWISANISTFGKKQVPNLENVYFIGDAISTIHPASGNGLAMGLTSGVLAAEHIISSSQTNFNSTWDLRYSGRLNYAKIIHSFFISEKKAKLGFRLANLFPAIVNIFYKMTRDRF